MDQETEDRIVLRIIERILNAMPEVIGNLMTEHSMKDKVKKEFFDQHQEFKNHLDVVAKVVEVEEGKELGQSFESILNNSIPRIKEQIKLKTQLDLEGVKDKALLDLNTRIDDSFGEL